MQALASHKETEWEAPMTEQRCRGLALFCLVSIFQTETLPAYSGGVQC